MKRKLKSRIETNGSGNQFTQQHIEYEHEDQENPIAYSRRMNKQID